MATAISTDAAALRMANDPPRYFGYSHDAAHRAPREEIDELQRAGLRQRFRDLRDDLPVLKSAADEQGIAAMDRIEDGARMLFPHTVYKSYPVSLLEKNRFDQMTKWLNRLTTNDLSKALGQPVVIEHRPGADGIVGAQSVARAAPDGYTLIVALSSFTTAPYQQATMPYDPAADFAAIIDAASLRA